MHKKTLTGRLLLGALYLSIAVAVLVTLQLAVSPQNKNTGKVIFRGEEIIVTIADTPALRERGLSGYKDLGEKEGMLFVFDEPNTYGFWMKDMLFSIDIIWLDENLSVVDIWENATPDSYPKIVTPRLQAKYVLEVLSGFSAKHALKAGDVLEFETPPRYNKK